MSNITIEYIKKLGKERCEKNLDLLLQLYKENFSIDIKREIVSSIGRQYDLDKIYKFISCEAFKKSTYMELIYQMYRTTLYKSSIDKRFETLRERIELFYDNEVIKKMHNYFFNKKKLIAKRNIYNKPILLKGDSKETLKKLEESSVHLIFTSPPYYNARAYSDYISYKDYLNKMKEVLASCHYVLEEGRFIIINVSPVITKRPGREFESIRYPIHFDFHRILIDTGFYFVDEIIWIKPEYSVKNRIGGYLQTQCPLSYKPNCVTESLLVYRKEASFLLDENIKKAGSFRNNDEKNYIDTTNCWYISPKSDKNHPAVFPDELCEKVLKYYSFPGDVVLDPFAGSGTLGRVAKKMQRIPIMCEINEDFIKRLEEEGYDEL